MKYKAFALAGAAIALSSIPAVAHHSFAMFDADKKVTIEGTIKEFQWTNPHSWILVMVPNAEGAPVQWSLETTAPTGLSRAGWTPKTLTPGMKVSVAFHPLKDGTSGGQFIQLTLPDGTVKGGRLAPSATAAAAAAAARVSAAAHVSAAAAAAAAAAAN
jgi:Family of unknown function (DUF6152)